MFERMGYGIYELVTFWAPTYKCTYKPPYQGRCGMSGLKEYNPNGGLSEFPAELSFQSYYKYSRQPAEGGRLFPPFLPGFCRRLYGYLPHHGKRSLRSGTESGGGYPGTGRGLCLGCVEAPRDRAGGQRLHHRPGNRIDVYHTVRPDEAAASEGGYQRHGRKRYADRRAREAVERVSAARGRLP